MFLLAIVFAIASFALLRFHENTCAPSHFETLQIPQNATRPEILKAYRQQMRREHFYMPDKNTGKMKEQKEKAFHRLVAAYEVLSDDHDHATYLQRLNTRPGYVKSFCEMLNSVMSNDS